MFSKFRNIYKALAMGRKGGFYAVRTGRKTGVFRTWEECERHVKGFTGARFKKFTTEHEALAFASGAVTSSTASESRKRSLEDVSDYDLCDSSTNPRKFKYHKPYNRTSAPSLNVDALFNAGSCSDVSSSSSQPVVYTDGCCTKNGRNGARAGVGVYWGPDHKHNLSERLQGEQTNQRAEIMAAVRAIETAKALGFKSLEIKTDSKYTINGATDWSVKWKKNGWKTINGTEVKNKADFQKLTTLCGEIDVKWTHVRGHHGIPGNEAADSLAKEGAEKI